MRLTKRPKQETGRSPPEVSITLGFNIRCRLSLKTLRDVKTRRRPLRNPLRLSTLPYP
jgi:hypothetical protein